MPTKKPRTSNLLSEKVISTSNHPTVFQVIVQRTLAAKNLSRTLEDAGTVFVPLVPWSAAGAYMTATLGVETLDYLPWAILCYTGFIFAIIYGFTGFGIAKLDKEETKK